MTEDAGQGLSLARSEQCRLSNGLPQMKGSPVRQTEAATVSMP